MVPVSFTFKAFDQPPPTPLKSFLMQLVISDGNLTALACNFSKHELITQKPLDYQPIVFGSVCQIENLCFLYPNICKNAVTWTFVRDCIIALKLCSYKSRWKLFRPTQGPVGRGKERGWSWVGESLLIPVCRNICGSALVSSAEAEICQTWST